ncbi:EXS family-domain-containing protein, partial [Sparassis latifolia]
MSNEIPDELMFSAAFPLPFRVFCLAGLGILGWAANLHWLQKFGLDPAATLKLHNYEDRYRGPPLIVSLQMEPDTAWPYEDLYRLVVVYTVWVGTAWLLFRRWTHGDLLLVDTFKYVPAVTALTLLMALVCPYKILKKHERDRFLFTIRRCLFPANERVLFADIVFADVFTSYAKVLGDLWLSWCMLMPGGSLLVQPTQEGWSRWILPTLMSFPYAVRFRQCLLEYIASKSGDRRPLLNALKYASSFPVIYLSAAQRMVVSDLMSVKGEAVAREAWHGEHHLFRLWLLAALVNSLYSFWWDVTYDWGFDLLLPGSRANRAPPKQLVLPHLHSRSSLLNGASSPTNGALKEAHLESGQLSAKLAPSFGARSYPFGLRPTLLLPLPIYPFAIFADLVLRLTWSVKLSSHLHSYSEGDLAI